MADGLSIISKFSGQLKDVSLVEAKGIVDGGTNTQFKQEMMSLVDKDIKMIVLDLQALEYINSAGLGSIMETRNKLEEAGGLLVIVGAGGKVKKVMEMVGFASVLPMAGSLQEAKDILEEFMTRREAEGVTEVTRFPRNISCTSCQTSFEVSAAGPSKCPACDELLHIEDTGRVFSLTPHDLKKEKGITGVMELSSDLRLLRLLRQFVAGFCKEHGFQDSELEDIELAIDEGSTNIVEHAYNRDPNCLIKMQLEAFEDRIVVLLIDNGKAFDNSNATPDGHDRVSDGHVSGLGRYFMQTTMDEVNYITIPGVSNTLKLVKYKAGFKPVEEALEDSAAAGRAAQVTDGGGQEGRGEAASPAAAVDQAISALPEENADATAVAPPEAADSPSAPPAEATPLDGLDGLAASTEPVPASEDPEPTL